MTAIGSSHIKKICKSILICLLGGMIMFGFFGCKDKNKDQSEDSTVTKYKVNYDNKSWYENAKDEYAAGEEVELYYSIIATDTDYSFTLDGGPLNYSYDDDKGFVIRFTMPEHDVTLKCISKNSMVYEPPTEQEDVLLIDSYHAIVGTDGGDGYDEISVYTNDQDTVRLHVYHQQGDEAEVETVYLVPYEVVDKCYEIIGKYKLREWKTRQDTVSLDGALMVCKFKDDDLYVRVSSEKMPEDGEAAFTEIENLLKSYVKDEYLAQNE